MAMVGSNVVAAAKQGEQVQDLTKGLALSWAIPAYQKDHHDALVKGLTTLASSPIPCTEIGELKLVLSANQTKNEVKCCLKATAPVTGLLWTISIGHPNLNLMAAEENDRTWAKGLWESRVGGSSTVPFTLELNVFEDEMDKFVSPDGTLNIYAQVSPSSAAKKSSKPGGSNNASALAKKAKKSSSAGKSPSSPSSSSSTASSPSPSKVTKFKAADVVAVRNETGGLWFGKLTANLNLATQASAKIQWFEESGKGPAMKLSLTNSKDNVPSQSIHPAALDLVQDGNGFWKPKDPRMVKRITELYTYAPL